MPLVSRSRLASIALLPLLLLCTCLQTAKAQQPPATSTEVHVAGAQSAAGDPKLPTLWIVGNEDGNGVTGEGREARWISAFTPLLDAPRINLADRSVRSSSIRGYLADGRWSDVVSAIKPGDFVLLQFGERSPAQEIQPDQVSSLPGVSDDMREGLDPIHHRPELVHTYGWYLRQYAVEAIAHGATPIVCAPVPQSSASPSVDSAWSRAIAVQQRIPFVDLPAAMRYLSTSGAASGVSGSVTNATPDVDSRPDLVAASIVAGLKGLPGDPLSGYFSSKGNAVAPYRPPPPPPPLP